MTADQHPGAGVRFEPSRKLYPFASHYFESRTGGRVHYVDEGRGQPILMCHGNPTWSFLYRRVITELRGRFRCVAVDYPGFGLSERPAGYGYTAAEHAEVVRELVAHLDLRDVIVMGHDWGGPIGLWVACSEPGRIGGLVLGNTWFWPSERRARIFGRAMSTPPMQRAILKRNVFVERLLPREVCRTLTEAELEHYRAVQPTPQARIGIAALPRQLLDAAPWLQSLAEDVPRKLGAKRTLITYPMRDLAFPAAAVLPRMRGAFDDVEVLALPEARHLFLEDESARVASAIAARFEP